MITGAVELLIMLAGALAAFFALRPYVPTWAWYAFEIGVALYGLLRILEDGLTARSGAFFALFTAAAVHTWWHDLRRGGKRQRQPCERKMDAG